MTIHKSYHIYNESGISVPFESEHLIKVIHLLQQKESCRFEQIELVFVDDETIRTINRKYLNHDFITDIITFPFHDEGEMIEGTLYCCSPQILRQAGDFQETFDNEILRVVIHGLLHLIGYGDHTSMEKQIMRNLEDTYIKIFRSS